MPFDAIFMSCLKKELEGRTVGHKIDKVQQPDRDHFLFTMRTGKLLVSLNSSGGRTHFTDESFENPQTPPMFCMLLRKHLIGGRIVSVTQPGLERSFDIEFETYDALGIPSKRHLIIELLGRYTNLIITDGDGIIIDCVRRIGFDVSDKRQVLPGLLYRLPPPTGKLDPFECDMMGEFAKLATMSDIRLDKWLNQTFDGFSPLICREIVLRAYGRTDIRTEETAPYGGIAVLFIALSEFLEDLREGKDVPYILYDAEGKPYDFSFMPIQQYGDICSGREMGSYSELLSEFYSKRDKIERMRIKTQAIYRNIRRARDRTVRRTAAQMDELLRCADRETFRENGDLIMSNMHNMKKGMTVLIADDYYSENGGTREISLDPLKTPQQNAAAYYKEYTKSKTAEIHLNEQIRKGEMEAEYLLSVMEALEKAETERDVTEIRQELMASGYLKGNKAARKERPVEQKPMRFVSSSGFEILVGKNNAQNDRLTMKTALSRDIWLHVQKIHGSHVVISSGGREVDDETLTEAAKLAAYYSQAKDSENVPVDYTLVKYVKKPSGARPGMVIYTDYKTLFVTPDEALTEKLRVK